MIVFRFVLKFVLAMLGQRVARPGACNPKINMTEAPEN